MQSDNKGYNFESHEKFFWNQHQALTESDEIVLEEVIELFQKNHAINLEDIQITVERGKVLLQGEISDDSTNAWIKSFLEDIPGVRSIDNQLKVNENGTRPTLI